MGPMPVALRALMVSARRGPSARRRVVAAHEAEAVAVQVPLRALVVRREVVVVAEARRRVRRSAQCGTFWGSKAIAPLNCGCTSVGGAMQ